MHITDSEKYIMDILWEESPLTAQQIIDRLDPALEWQDKTIKTLINRLLKKNALHFEKEGRRYLYSPLIKEQDYIRQASESFVERVFRGDVKSLIAAFARPEKLSKDDLAEIREMIDALDKQGDKR